MNNVWEKVLDNITSRVPLNCFKVILSNGEDLDSVVEKVKMYRENLRSFDGLSNDKKDSLLQEIIRNYDEVFESLIDIAYDSIRENMDEDVYSFYSTENSHSCPFYTRN